MWTCWGPVRGGCGHAHRSAQAARQCVVRDARGAARQGGYSDRAIRRIAGPEDVRRYDVIRGPGRPVAPGEEGADG